MYARIEGAPFTDHGLTHAEKRQIKDEIRTARSIFPLKQFRIREILVKGRPKKPTEMVRNIQFAHRSATTMIRSFCLCSFSDRAR